MSMWRRSRRALTFTELENDCRRLDNNRRFAGDAYRRTENLRRQRIRFRRLIENCGLSAIFSKTTSIDRRQGKGDKRLTELAKSRKTPDG